jgi:hypothetical protein
MKRQQRTQEVLIGFNQESIRRSRGEAKAAEDESRLRMVETEAKRSKWGKAKKSEKK